MTRDSDTSKPFPVRVIVAALLLAVLVGAVVWADVIPPVNLQMKEADDSTILVQWKVPLLNLLRYLLPGRTNFSPSFGLYLFEFICN